MATPETNIELPAIAKERIALFHAQELAADQAASALMNTAMVDWQGRGTSLLALSQSIGNADHIRAAARDVFMALTSHGITYRQFHEHMGSRLSAMTVPTEAKRAIHHFKHVISDSLDLQSVGLGDGELLLVPFDWHINRYLEAHSAKAPARRTS